MMAARAMTSQSSTPQFSQKDNDEEDKNIPNQITTLHHNLSTSNWSTALKTLRTNPQSASLWIINRHGRMLPLHAALLYGAPSHVVMEVLNAHPDAAKEKDLQGRLPIHIAASMAAIISLDDDNGEQRVLNELVRVYPESMWIPDEGGRTAMELVEILQLVQSNQEEEDEEEEDERQLKREVQPLLKGVMKDSEMKSKGQSLNEQHQYCQQLDDALAEQQQRKQQQSQLQSQQQEDQYKSIYDLLSQGIAPSHTITIPHAVSTETESDDDCSPVKQETTNKEKVCSKKKELHTSDDLGSVGKEKHKKQPLEPPKQIIINSKVPQHEDDSVIHADDRDEVWNDRDNDVTSCNEITHAFSGSFDKNEEVATTTTTATTHPSLCNETNIANSNSAAGAMEEITENGTNKANKRHLSNLGSKIQMRSKRRKKGSLMDLVSTIKTQAVAASSKEKESQVVPPQPQQCNCDTCNAAAGINEEMNVIKRALRSFDLVMPTLLFDYLVASHWGNVMARIRGAPSEVKAWARKEEDGVVVLDVLPLHAAIVLGAPSDIIIALLDTYPAGAGEIDSNRSFPIHLAAACLTCIRRGDLVVDHLLKAFRSGKHAVDAKGRTPSEIVSIMSTSHDHRKEHSTRIESKPAAVSHHESSKSMKEDAAFAYLVEKAMTNLDMSLKYQHSFLCQASMKGIETIDDLLMADDDFLDTLFSEKELTVELKRLLSIFIEGRG